MKAIIIDTREQAPLKFTLSNVEYVREALPAGDYGAVHDDGTRDKTVFERKSVADLFGSYGGAGYEREKDKFIRAKDSGLRFILGIEATAWDVRRGYEYFKGGEVRTHPKDGLSMVRMLMSITRSYDVPVWFCNGRVDLAFRIEEYFLAAERLRKRKKEVVA